MKHKLLLLPALFTGLTLAAAEAPAEHFREVTGEDILAAIRESGGTVEYIQQHPVTGVIEEIRASGRSSVTEAVIAEILATGALAPKKPLGDLAQTSVSLPAIGAHGDTTTNANIVTNLDISPSQLAVGMPVTGGGFPNGTTLSVINEDGSLVMSAASAAGASAAFLQFSAAQAQVIGLSEWTIDWKRKTVDSTTTDDAEYESAIGSTKSWSAKAKYMFIDADSSQGEHLLTAIDSLQVDAATWNFFPTVETGRAAFQGAAIIDGITLTSGMGKVVGLDVSLKGTGPLKRLAQVASTANSNTVTGEQAMV